MNKNRLFTIKYLCYSLFVIGLIISMLGCFHNKAKQINNDATDNFNIQPREEIIIKTENILETEIKERIEQINQDSTIPIRVDNNSQNCDVAVFIDHNPCDININETEIYSSSIALGPQSFADNLGKNFSDLGLKIKITSINKNQIYQIIRDYLKESFQKNPPLATKMTFVGDIMLARWVGKRMDEYGYDYPFSQTTELFSESDLNIANLESPFSTTGPYNQLGMVFRANPKGAESLKNAGINIVNLANNHFGNASQDGMETTFDLLNEKEISYFGAGNNSQESHQPLVKEINGIKFAFLGYSDSSVTPSSYASGDNRPGLNLDNTEQMKQDVAKAKEKADFVVVSIHLGSEYQHSPNQHQIDFAHSAIDAGADFIYGHHPHVVQSIEVYNNKPIFYSLGNYIFDQTTKETKEGLVVQTNYMFNKLINVKLIPITIINYAQANIANSLESENILEIIYLNSK